MPLILSHPSLAAPPPLPVVPPLTRFVDPFVTALGARIDEISRLRTTHEELLRLLSPHDRRQLRVDETFKPFARLQPLHVNSCVARGAGWWCCAGGADGADGAGGGISAATSALRSPFGMSAPPPAPLALYSTATRSLRGRQP